MPNLQAAVLERQGHSLLSIDCANLKPSDRGLPRDSEAGSVNLQQLVAQHADFCADGEVSNISHTVSGQDSMTLEHYFCHLRIKLQERCTIITSSEQGAQCIAVASPKPGCPNTLMVGQCTVVCSMLCERFSWCHHTWCTCVHARQCTVLCRRPSGLALMLEAATQVMQEACLCHAWLEPVIVVPSHCIVFRH